MRAVDGKTLRGAELAVLGPRRTEGEDHSSVRTGNGPQVMAALRNSLINIIRLSGGTNIAAHREIQLPARSRPSTPSPRPEYG